MPLMEPFILNKIDIEPEKMVLVILFERVALCRILDEIGPGRHPVSFFKLPGEMTLV